MREKDTHLLPILNVIHNELEVQSLVLIANAAQVTQGLGAACGRGLI